MKKSSIGRAEVGRIGEEAAASRLNQEGYVIVERNWRCRSGELDIIAECEQSLVIIEVRTKRVGSRFGMAVEAVDVRKQQQVRATAAVYIQMKKLWDKAVRFDVAAVTLDGNGDVLDIQLIKGAF